MKPVVPELVEKLFMQLLRQLYFWECASSFDMKHIISIDMATPIPNFIF